MRASLAITTVLMLSISACDTNLASLEPPAARDLLSPALRDACFWKTDAQIIFAIETAMAVRDGGLSRQDAFDSASQGCLEGCGGDAQCWSQCGGCILAMIDAVYSGEVSSGSPAPEPEIIPIASNTLRPFFIGDFFEYTFTEEAVEAATGVRSLWAGTRRHAIGELNDPRFGHVLTENVSDDRAVVEGSGAGNSSLTTIQTRAIRLPDGRLQVVGLRLGESGNEIVYVVSPEGGIPPDPDTALDVGDSYSADTIWSDGSTVSVTTVVSAIETVTVPAGTFQCFRVELNRAATDPNTQATTNSVASQWVSPALGVPVKIVTTTTTRLSTGGTGTLRNTAELGRTNIPF